jgi:hypothetical protein
MRLRQAPSRIKGLLKFLGAASAMRHGARRTKKKGPGFLRGPSHSTAKTGERALCPPRPSLCSLLYSLLAIIEASSTVRLL